MTPIFTASRLPYTLLVRKLHRKTCQEQCINFDAAEVSGVGAWAAAIAKAKGLVSQMTLEEKVSLTAGVSSSSNGCSGNVPNITRLGFPGMCLSDAGQGLRGADFVSSFPSGIHVGARYVHISTLAHLVMSSADTL